MTDWIEVVWRSLFSILVLFLMTRMLGYRQVGQLTFFQYITGITIGSLAAMLSIDLQHFTLAVTALIVWGLVSFGIEWLSLKSKTIRDMIDGKGIPLIKDGKILEDHLKKAKLTADDLLEQLRRKDVFKVADVEFAALETSGNVSVLLRREKQPLTSSHLGVTVPNEQEPQTVVMDGEILYEPLATIGLSPDWLHTELAKKGVTIENVFLAQVDQYGQLYLDLFDDQIKVPEPQNRAQLLATIKKCAADLELFALSTNNRHAKSMYGNCKQQMDQILEDVMPLLKR